MNKNILIASSSSDEHAYGPVAEVLERNHYPVVVYKADKVLSGEEVFTAGIAEDGDFAMSYQGSHITGEALGAAWYRKISNFSLPDVDQDIAKQLYMNNEVRAAHDTIWSMIPDNLWLNSPDAITRADRKFGQLAVAHEVGFTIPQTIMSSDWNEIVVDLIEEHPEAIIKMFRGVISDKNILKGMYTTRLNKDKINELALYTVPFPGLYQPFIEKSKEWRVTVVGDEVFATAIYTQGAAKTDWREHQLSKNVKFNAEKLPTLVSEKCLRYLGELGLKFGAFDLIETKDGVIVFLECNPNGQYGWLEEELGFPISKSIAKELMQIARATD